MNETQPSDDTKNDDTENGGVAQVYLLFLCSVALLLSVGSFVQIASLSQFGSVSFGLAFTEVLLILLPAIAFIRWKKVSVVEGLRLRPVSIPVAMLSVILGMGAWGVAIAIYLLTVPIVGEFPNSGLEAKTLSGLLLLIVCGAVLPGICEEALFRGAIQGVLRRRGSTWAVIVTSILFGLFHLHPSNILPPILIGIVLGFLVERTGSIVPAMLMHTATNTTAFTASYVIGNDADIPYPLMAGLAVVFVLAAVVAWRITANSEPELPALASVPAGIQNVAPKQLRRLGTAFATVMIVFFVAAFQFVGAYTMANDKLAPDISKGDAAIVLKQRWIQSEIVPGDIVSFQRGGKAFLRKVNRVKNDSVWIQVKDSPEQIPRSQITGKVIHVIRRNRNDGK